MIIFVSDTGKGRFLEAEEALCWLRGWVTPAHIENEFRDLCAHFEKPTIIKPVTSITLEQAHEPTKAEPVKKAWHFYLQRTFYLPFSLVTWAFFINAFGGIMVLQVFAVVILDELQTPIDK